MLGESSMAPTVLPHVGQKARDDQSDERQVAGGPPRPVQFSAERGNSTHATVSAPEWRRHRLHEQVCGFCAGPVAVKRM